MVCAMNIRSILHFNPIPNIRDNPPEFLFDLVFRYIFQGDGREILRDVLSPECIGFLTDPEREYSPPNSFVPTRHWMQNQSHLGLGF